jgi:hypothetical protein
MAAPQTSVSIQQGVAFDGMLGDASMLKDCRSYVNEEASAEIPFGVMVAQGTGDDGCLKLAATSDKLIGIVVHSHSYQKDNELGSTGLKPTVVLSVLTRGKIWVPVEEAVTPASDVLVRAVAGGSEVAGAFRDTADSTDCIDISSWARYLTSTTAAGRALLEFDVTNRGADKID